jgi:hypothetical protein
LAHLGLHEHWAFHLGCRGLEKNGAGSDRTSDGLERLLAQILKSKVGTRSKIGKRSLCADSIRDADGRKIPPKTLKNMRANGPRSTATHCLEIGCHHRGVLNVSRPPDDVPVPDVALRLRCSGCGSKNVGTVPDWREGPCARATGGDFGTRLNAGPVYGPEAQSLPHADRRLTPPWLEVPSRRPRTRYSWIVEFAQPGRTTPFFRMTLP